MSYYRRLWKFRSCSKWRMKLRLRLRLRLIVKRSRVRAWTIGINGWRMRIHGIISSRRRRRSRIHERRVNNESIIINNNNIINNGHFNGGLNAVMRSPFLSSFLLPLRPFSCDRLASAFALLFLFLSDLVFYEFVCLIFSFDFRLIFLLLCLHE